MSQVETGLTAPDDHFTAGPNRGVKSSAIWRIGSAGRCPSVGVGIVPPATV